MPDLGSSLTMDSSKFGAGIAEARAKLTELNTALIENRNKMKEVNEEARKLQQEERELSSAMKNGGTKEQQEELKKLHDRMGQVNTQLGTLRTRERELQSNIRTTSKELESQKTALKEIESGSAKAAQKIENMAEAEKKADTAAKDASGSIDSLKNKTTGMTSAIRTAVTAFAGKKLYDFFIGSNAEMEQYTTSFETMLKSTEKAQQLMDSLSDFATVTPMELTDVVPIGTLLMNYGVGADELIDKMTKLGDLSSGNAAKFERVSRAYGQMLAKGKVSGEELRQMTEAGVPLLQALADTLGTSTAEVQNMISKSKVGVDVLDKAIESLTTGTGQFAGMMDKQSQTFSGMMSTASDVFAQFGRDAGEDAFLAVKKSLAEFMDQVDKWKEDGTLNDIAEELGETVEDTVNIIKTAIGIVWNGKDAIISFAVAMGTFKAAISIGNTITATVTAIKSFKNAVDSAKASQVAFNAVGAANPFVLIGSLAASAVAGLIAFNTASYDASNGVKALAGDVKTFGDNAKTAAQEQAQLEQVIREYEEISNSVDTAINKKDKLAELQERLNSLYNTEKEGIDLVNGSYEEQISIITSLNEAEKTRQINQITSDLDKAKKSAADIAHHSLEFNVAYNKDNVGYIEAELNKIIEKMGTDEFGTRILDSVSGSISGESGNLKMLLQGDIDTQIEALEMLQEALLETGEASGENAEAYDAVYDRLEQLKEIQTSVAEGEKALSLLNGELAESTEEISNQTEIATESTKELSNSLEEYISKLSETAEQSEFLKTAIDKLNKGNTLTYSDIKKLIEISPELADNIQARADGYYVEAAALMELNSVIADGAKAEIQAEIEKTEAAIKGAEERIRVYQAEAATYAQNTSSVAAGEEVRRRSQLITEALAEIEASRISLSQMKIEGLRLENSVTYTSSGDTGSSSGSDNEKEKEHASLSSYEASMKNISSAFKEQSENGSLSVNAIHSITEAGYGAALITDELTGKVSLNAEKYRKLAEAELEAYNAQILLEKTDLSIKGLDTSGVEAKIAAVKMLSDSLNEVVSGKYGETVKASDKGTDKDNIYEESLKQYERTADKKLELIDKELEAKKRLRDETLKAIEEEVEARKRLNEDNDIQKQIDQVTAQLRYSQLDEFSRHQLERKLSSLKDEQAEIAWQRNIEDRKAAVNAEYEEAETFAKAEKEKLDNAVDSVKEIMTELASGITNIMNVVNTAITNNNTTNNNTANVSFAAQSLTPEQIIRIVNDYYGVVT